MRFALLCIPRFFCCPGLDHLLHDGRGVGGASSEESAELHMACFMGLVSFLASTNEVLRVDTWHHKVGENTINTMWCAWVIPVSVENAPPAPPQ